MSARKILLLLLFLATAFAPAYCQDESTLVKIKERLYELKKIRDDKLQEIDRLEATVLSVSSQNYRLRKEKEDQRRTIQAKTEEIHRLRSELNDILIEYSRIEINLEQVKHENDGLREVIKQLQDDKRILNDQLEVANSKIVALTDSLTRLHYENESLVAEYKALEKRIDAILNEKKSVNFVEISLNMFNSVDFSFQKGILIKGSNMYLGGRVGYAYIKSKTDTGFPVALSLIPATLQVGVAVKRKLGFEYVGMNEKIWDNYKLFFMLEGGWSQHIGKGVGSYYDRGGLLLSGGSGIILNVNENANAYGKAKINLQSVRNKESGNTRLIFSIGAGFGIMF
ncbi:MAG: hypothetical protein R3D58_13700 [Saprospiraceae bacterium]